MKKPVYVLIVVFLFVVSISAQAPLPSAAPATPPPPAVAWAYNIPSKNPPPQKPETGPIHIPGSSKTYLRAQIGNFHNVPDWFPNEHGPAPSVVLHGNGKAVLACGTCHGMSGLGHPESANLTGLSTAYFLGQLADFKSGARKANMMPEIAAAMSEQEAKEAAAYFASLKRQSSVKVVETDTVPKTYVDLKHMRLPLPGGGMEPLGKRIIEVPEDVATATVEDPHTKFIAYVPKGSIAKGEKIVMDGAGNIGVGCTACHGLALKGLADVPRIAGLSPTYIFRQIISVQNGDRNGAAIQPMKPFVAPLSVDQAIDVAAYLGSLPE
ncbi:MAG TPA: c-type cytochrome [Candidatus Dormibacteraeota bacterium]|nr:c-type cytochrome [Candidatus Dormibacteraeota bacterium]